jgi:hypothetical protein
MSCSNTMRNDAETCHSLTSSLRGSKWRKTKQLYAMCPSPADRNHLHLIRTKFCKSLSPVCLSAPPSVEEEKSPLTWGSGYRRSNLQRALSGSPPHHNDSISLLVRIPPLRGGFIARHSVTPGLGVLRGSGDRTNRCPSNSYSFAVAAASRYPFTCAGKRFRRYFTLSGLTTKSTSVVPDFIYWLKFPAYFSALIPGTWI